MEETDREQLRELVKSILKLVEGDEDWMDSSELSTDDLEKITKIVKEGDNSAILVKMLWYILREIKDLKENVKELEEIKKNQTLSDTGTYPVIQPYTPYIPYTPQPTVPKPWEVWYDNRTSPFLDPFGPVTCTYSDTEGHEVTFDRSKPMAVTYTYSSGSNNLLDPFDEK